MGLYDSGKDTVKTTSNHFSGSIQVLCATPCRLRLRGGKCPEQILPYHKGAENAEIAQRVQKKTFQRNNLSSSFVTPHEVDFPDSFEVLI